ncbi:MAG: hemolysin family protein [Bacteroidetes bacterium]|nr:hemolysin family protein [Bacteroidota bacterium]
MNKIFKNIFSLLNNLFGNPKNISEEAVIEAIDQGKSSGVINSTEHALIKSILEFSDTIVKEIMVSREDMAALNISSTREQIISAFINEGYSRIPVFDNSLNKIVGILYAKDLLSIIELQNIIIVRDIIRPVMFIPESKKISELLKELQSKRQHIAIVVNEFGETEGLVTIEDILEEIVGEIRDEYDEEKTSILKSKDGSDIVSGKLRIEDFNLLFPEKIPESKEYSTLSGFLHKITGKIPELKEEIKYKKIVFIIEASSPRRIRQIKINIK